MVSLDILRHVWPLGIDKKTVKVSTGQLDILFSRV